MAFRGELSAYFPFSKSVHGILVELSHNFLPIYIPVYQLAFNIPLNFVFLQEMLFKDLEMCFWLLEFLNYLFNTSFEWRQCLKA